MDDIHGTSTTNFDGNLKSIVRKPICTGDQIVQKIYIKDEHGKFKPLSRRSFYPNREWWILPAKEVEYQENGNSITSIVEFGDKHVVIRDKKGKILEDYTVKSNAPKKTDAPKKPDAIKPPKEKEYAAWYKKYLVLCKKYDHQPYKEPKAAWKDFRELLLWDTDKEAYWRYMDLQKYRARYNAEALKTTLGNEYASYIESLPAYVREDAISFIQEAGYRCNENYKLVVDYVSAIHRIMITNPKGFNKQIIDELFKTHYSVVSVRLLDVEILKLLKAFKPEMSEKESQTLFKYIQEALKECRLERVSNQNSVNQANKVQQTITQLA
jgi:hypothetical protein